MSTTSSNFGLNTPISDNPLNEQHLLQLLAAQELPSWWNILPKWVAEGFEKDQMAAQCEQVQHVPFLLSGRRPAVGQRLYMQLTYDHDGSHPQCYRGWARMVGEVTKVLPPPPAGLYARYPRQTIQLTEEELSFLRKNMPEMPSSFLESCTCGIEHTEELVLRVEGAVHGQAVLAKIRLSCDDVGRLVPQLAGEWDAMLICNDQKNAFWEIRALKRAGGL